MLFLGLVPPNLKCVMDAFFKNEFTALSKKLENWPRDTQKVIFLKFFDWKYAKSNHMGLSFKYFWRQFFPNTLNHLHFNISSSSTNWKACSILQIVDSPQIYHFLAIHIPTEAVVKRRNWNSTKNHQRFGSMRKLGVFG